MKPKEKENTTAARQITEILLKEQPTLLEAKPSVDKEETCLELSSLREKQSMEGPGWHIQEKQQIKHHSQGSCHLLEVVSASRVQNGTCLEKFKRF